MPLLSARYHSVRYFIPSSHQNVPYANLLNEVVSSPFCRREHRDSTLVDQPRKAMVDAGFQSLWAFLLETNIECGRVWAAGSGVLSVLAGALRLLTHTGSCPPPHSLLFIRGTWPALACMSLPSILCPPWAPSSQPEVDGAMSFFPSCSSGCDRLPQAPHQEAEGQPILFALWLV